MKRGVFRKPLQATGEALWQKKKRFWKSGKSVRGTHWGGSSKKGGEDRTESTSQGRIMGDTGLLRPGNHKRDSLGKPQMVLQKLEGRKAENTLWGPWGMRRTPACWRVPTEGKKKQIKRQSRVGRDARNWLGPSRGRTFLRMQRGSKKGEKQAEGENEKRGRERGKFIRKKKRDHRLRSPCKIQE